MTEFLRRHNLLFSSLFLVVCSFQLMSFSLENRNFPRFGARLVTSILAPVQEFHHELFQSLRGAWSHYVWLLTVEEERNGLLLQVKQLEEKNSTLIEFERENERLRSLLNFSQETGHRGVVASVVGHDPSNWLRMITIDKGEKDGISPGLAVVDGHAIVGQVTVVTNSSAKVLLLTDHLSAIDAIVQSSRAPGIAEGMSSGDLSLKFVSKEDTVMINDRVIASGLDGVYPKGMLIGVVTAVNTEVSGQFQSVDVLPRANFRHLETVLVLLPSADSPLGAIESPTPEKMELGEK